MQAGSLQGADDQIEPLATWVMPSVKLMPQARPKIDEGASHGLCMTHANRVIANPFGFIQS